MAVDDLAMSRAMASAAMILPKLFSNILVSLPVGLISKHIYLNHFHDTDQYSSGAKISTVINHDL